MINALTERIANPASETESNPEVSEPPGLRLATLPYHSKSEHQEDHFIEHNGIKYAGKHLIIDLWGVSNIDCTKSVEAALRESVKSCNATLLTLHLHLFTPNNGISGVAILAESHISIHTWPERQYAALDIFMCGNSEPEKAIAVLKKAFKPTTISINQQIRGALHE